MERRGAARWARAAVSLCWLLTAATLASAPAPPDSACDRQLKPPSADPNAYSPRDDRCEGIYFREVASTTLLVAGLTESMVDLDPATAKALLLEWTAPAGEALHIRARALRHRLYYQMDTLQPAASGSYAWPTGLLARFNLRSKELGLLAWTPRTVGGATRDVYVPLRLRQAAGSRSPTYQLSLLPGVELAEVFITLSSVGADGGAGTVIQKDEPLEYGFYPADRVITVPLPPLPAAGTYALEIKALRRAGGSASAPTLWFYNPGR